MTDNAMYAKVYGSYRFNTEETARKFLHTVLDHTGVDASGVKMLVRREGCDVAWLRPSTSFQCGYLLGLAHGLGGQ